MQTIIFPGRMEEATRRMEEATRSGGCWRGRGRRGVAWRRGWIRDGGGGAEWALCVRTRFFWGEWKRRDGGAGAGRHGQRCRTSVALRHPPPLSPSFLPPATEATDPRPPPDPASRRRRRRVGRLRRPICRILRRRSSRPAGWASVGAADTGRGGSAAGSRGGARPPAGLRERLPPFRSAPLGPALLSLGVCLRLLRSA